MAASHPALNKTERYLNKEKNLLSEKLLKKGFIVLKNLISKSECNNLINDLNFLRGKYPYHLENNNTYAGVFRSPFIFFDSYRKLLLNSQFQNILRDIFPSNYQLHLSRCVENKPNKTAATIEWHRDIPHLHTPSKFPISLSFLTFFSESNETQIEIRIKSHDEYFYNSSQAEILSLNPNPGDTLVFDSNLIHRTLPTEKIVLYNLYMFTSPIIKPVVNYSSDQIISKINENQYRIDEINKILGYEFLVPKDDLEYIKRHE